MALGYK